MARPTKQGIDYFSFDVNFFNDIKIRKITRACGTSSASILICLLCNIYKDKGYYILWDEDLPFLVADSIGTSEGAVKEVVQKAVQVGFFNQDIFERYNVLTSAGIQLRFKAATLRRGEMVIDNNYLIIDDKNKVIAYKNPVIDDNSTQSKVKERKVNKKTSKKDASIEASEIDKLDFVDSDFKEIFSLWLDYKRERREKYKSLRSIKISYENLVNLSGNNPNQAELIVRQSIASNWAGLFELKNKSDEKQKHENIVDSGNTIIRTAIL